MSYKDKSKAQLIEKIESLINTNKELESSLAKQEKTKILKEREKNYKSLIYSSIDPIYVLQNEHFVLVNKAWEELFEYTSLEALSVDFDIYKIIAPESRNFLTQRFEAVSEKEREFSKYEFKGISKSGNIFDLEAHVSLITWNGKPAYQGIYRDITERKKTEEALRRESFIFENLYDAVIITDMKGQILNWNKAAEKLYGYSKNEILNRCADLITKETSPASFIKQINQTIEEKGSWTGEVDFIRKDGSAGISESIITPYLDNEGNKIALVVVNRDITERKKYENELQKFSRAVEQSPNSIMISDKTGDIEYVNPMFTNLTGYTLDEVKGKNPRILKSGHTDNDTYKNLWETITSGKIWWGEFHNKNKNGYFYWVSASISPIVNSAGKITHFIAIEQDITESKRIHKELITAKEKAEESDRLKSEFLAQMSHEIRSPLNVILSYNSYIKEELEDKMNDDLKSVFPAVDSAGKRLLRTIELILNMAAAQTGNLELSMSIVDLSANLKELIKEFEHSAQIKNIELNLVIKSQQTKIMADEYILSEIFQNLINNAIKYTPEGKIEVILYTNENKNICVDISDTGIGISQKYLPFLFQPFTQEEAGYSRKFEGNGLGLALVKKYAEILDAEIKVKTEKGKGSVFTVSFKNPAVSD